MRHAPVQKPGQAPALLLLATLFAVPASPGTSVTPPDRTHPSLWASAQGSPWHCLGLNLRGGVGECGGAPESTDAALISPSLLSPGAAEPDCANKDSTERPSTPSSESYEEDHLRARYAEYYSNLRQIEQAAAACSSVSATGSNRTAQTSISQLLLQAANEGKVEEIKALLKRGADPNVRDTRWARAARARVSLCVPARAGSGSWKPCWCMRRSSAVRLIRAVCVRACVRELTRALAGAGRKQDLG